MKPLSPPRIFMIASIAALFISYLGIWQRFINDPVERTGSDFIAFYSAGRIAQNRGIQSVYNIPLQQEVQEAELGFPLMQGQVLLYNHLPFLIPFLKLIVVPDYVASFYRWIILLIVVYSAGIAILSKILNRGRVDQNSNLLLGIGGLLFLPVFFSLMNGQDTAFLLLGIAIWMYGLISGKEMLAGLGLSLATVRPHIALFLAVPMLFRYRKIFLGFLLGSTTLALFSVLLLGLGGTEEFINIILLSSGGEWYGMKENAMYNLIGLLAREIPQFEAGIIRALGWIVYGIVAVYLGIRWFKEPDWKGGLIGLTIILALFTAPHLHFHDLVLLLIPIYELVQLNRENSNIEMSIVISLPLTISLLLLVSNISPTLHYTIPYLIMVALAIYPYYQKSWRAVITRRRS